MTSSRPQPSTPTAELVSLSSLRSESDDYWLRVLSLCHQNNPSKFAIEFSSAFFTNFKYLDSGTYSHVIKAVDLKNESTPVVFKIIKVLQRATMNRLNDLSFKGCELYQDVFQEIVIIKLLSNLHQTVVDGAGYEYQAHSFPRIYRTRIVHGDIPNYFLIRKYNETYAKVKAVERFDDVFGMPRESLVIMMKFGGDSLWDRIQPSSQEKCISPDQMLSVCYQVTLALAVAEMVYQFEHRDLHVCNILVKLTKKRYATFKLRSVEYRVKSFGIKACIIDATFSRMAVGRNRYFTDLSNRLKGTAANTNPDGQEVAYQQMYRLIHDRWRDWYPETNVIWLKYFYLEILNSDGFQSEADKGDETLLRQLVDDIADFKMVSDFVFSLFRKAGDHGSSRYSSRTQAAGSMSNLN